MPIKLLIARQILDVFGIPTVEVDMVTELWLFRVGVPSTDRRKAYEAYQLRDNILTKYNCMGVNNAVKNINTIIAPELIKQNLEVTMQKEIDQFMIALDGSDSKSRLGSNAILAVSMVIAKAGAAKKGVPLYRHISDMAGVTALVLPVSHFTILTGGSQSTNGLPFQEYSIMPTGASSFSEALKMGSEIYSYMKKVIRDKFGVNSTYVNDCGGFSVPLQSDRDALLFITDAIKQCGFFGKVEIAINVSASEMYKDAAYDMDFKNPNSNPTEYLSSEKLTEVYLDDMKEFPVVSFEDPFKCDDWSAYSLMTPRTLNQILGNDLTQTNTKRIAMAVEKKSANALAIRINQASTISEVIDAYKLMKSNGLGICVVDRQGDTDDLFLADLVVGLSAGQLKCGAPARGERIGKYNQVLRIEEELGALAKYAGKNDRGQI